MQDVKLQEYLNDNTAIKMWFDPIGKDKFKSTVLELDNRDIMRLYNLEGFDIKIKAQNRTLTITAESI